MKPKTILYATLFAVAALCAIGNFYLASVHYFSMLKIYLTIIDIIAIDAGWLFINILGSGFGIYAALHYFGRLRGK